MPEIQKVSVALTGEQVALLKGAVETGEYATTSEAIREALRDWQWKRELRGEELKRLREGWREGKASGPGGAARSRQNARGGSAATEEDHRQRRMRPVLLWTPQAREDLLDIYVTIGMDNPSAAERMYTAMEEKAALLVRYPRLGVRRPEIATAARMLVEGVYLLLYETHPDSDDGPVDEVEIVRVVHGHRDLTNIL